MERSELPIITRSGLVDDLRNLGVLPGQVIMLHASVRAIGWIVGGPDTVLQALLDVLTPVRVGPVAGGSTTGLFGGVSSL